MKKLSDLSFLACFLAIFLTVRALTLLLSSVRFKSFIKLFRRRVGGSARAVYLEVFSPDNAGYQYRARKWAGILGQHGIAASVKYVFERKEFEVLLAEERIGFFFTIFLLVRIWQCLLTVTCDCVIVRRELLQYNDYGDLFLEKLLLSLHPNVILDFDDDIGADKKEGRSLTIYGRLMREHPAKFSQSLKLYPRFIVGSPYLRQLVQRRRGGVADGDIVVIPTCVDYERYPAKSYRAPREFVTFGWVGSTGNQYLLRIVLPALNAAARRHKIRMVVISGKEYQADADFEIVNVRWGYEKEIENLRLIDIGLMPLYDAELERGKCGFKLIQYMGLGIVSIASAVTINNEIVDDGVNGFLVRHESDWPTVVEKALAASARFAEIGAAARRKIYDNYSFAGNTQKYLDFIRAGLA